MARRALTLALCAALAGWVATAEAVPITIMYGDQPRQGFLDPTVGPARQAALQFAVNIWSTTLAGTAPVVVETAMLSAGGTGTDALLASTEPVTIHRGFPGAQANTWYVAALANQLAGTDLNGADMPEILMLFNVDVDTPEVLGSIGWYYGLDGEPGSDIDFVTIALHELGHGLGFFDTIDATFGFFDTPTDQPGIFDRMLFRPGVGGIADMRDAERLAAIVSGNLFWDGPDVLAFAGSPAPLYAPDPFQPGASVSHWDPTALPNELIQPFYTHAVHDPGLLLPALLDMGWQPAAPTPTPRAPAATPTVTWTPQPTATPGPQGTPHEVVYVSNFDDGTVSVIDGATYTVTDTVAVGNGPLGVAAAPDGTRIYVANFQDGSLSVVDTQTDTVAATIPVGDSANGVVVTPDGAFVVVTDTAADRATIVAADTLAPVAAVEAGMQPSGIALDPTGQFALIPDYGGETITVVDIAGRLRRAIIPPAIDASRPLAIAIAATTGDGVVTQYQSHALTPINATAFAIGPSFFPPANEPIEAVLITRDGTLAYGASHGSTTVAGRVMVIDVQRQTVLGAVPVALVPEALALSADEQSLYVANAGSNTVWVVNTAQRKAAAIVHVGQSPMGLAVAEVPTGPCDGTCDNTPTPIPTTTATAAPSMPATPLCGGDCNGDGVVSVNELVAAVAISLGSAPVSTCEAADVNRSGTVTIEELVEAVSHALSGCG